MGDFAITEELKEAFLSQNIEYFPIREATPEEFYEAIGRAKITNEHGAFVTQHTVNDYKEMSHLFITLDGTAGIAITPDNNIVSVFNGGEKRGVLLRLRMGAESWIITAAKSCPAYMSYMDLIPFLRFSLTNYLRRMIGTMIGMGHLILFFGYIMAIQRLMWLLILGDISFRGILYRSFPPTTRQRNIEIK